MLKQRSIIVDTTSLLSLLCACYPERDGSGNGQCQSYKSKTYELMINLRTYLSEYIDALEVGLIP